MQITPETLLQTQNAAGNWNAPRPLAEIAWCGRPLRSLLSDEQIATLESGRGVRFAADWYANVRLPRSARPAAPAPQYTFTCPTCGGHRDTTLRGQCDDCRA